MAATSESRALGTSLAPDKAINYSISQSDIARGGKI